MKLEEVVDYHQDAYRNKDLEKLIDTMHTHIEVYDIDANLMYKGTSEAKKRYKDLFDKVGEILMSRVSRIIQDNYIIDKLIITGVKERPVELVEISLVESEKITKKWFII